VLGHEYWLLEKDKNLPHAHQMWPEAKDVPWVQQTMKRSIFNRVEWYQSGGGLRDEWERRNPGKKLSTIRDAAGTRGSSSIPAGAPAKATCSPRSASRRRPLPARVPGRVHARVQAAVAGP
jgi:hypothetical protein